MHKRLQHGLRYCTYTISVVIIVFALLLQATRLLTPSVNYLIPSIQQWLSEKTQSQVTIGDIHAQWYGLRPHVILHDVAIIPNEIISSTTIPELISAPFDESESSLLSIDYAEFGLDLLTSALTAEWVWDTISLQHVHAKIAQLDDGTLLFAGFPLPNDARRDQTYRNPIHLFETLPDVDVSDITLQFRLANQTVINATIPIIKTEKQHGFQRLQAALHIDDQPVLSLLLEKQLEKQSAQSLAEKNNGMHSEEKNSSVVSYIEPYSMGFISLTDFPVGVVTSLSQGVFPRSFQRVLDNDKRIHSSQLSGRYWFDFSDKSSLRFLGDMNATIASSALQNESKTIPIVARIQAYIAGDTDSERQWDVSVGDFLIDNKVMVGDLQLSGNGKKSNLQIERVELSIWSSWISETFKLPDEQQEAILRLSPSGIVHHVQIDVDLDDVMQSRIAANVTDFSSKALENIPGFSHVNGYVETGVKTGFINIDAENMHFFPQKIYDQPLEFSAIKGQVAWYVDAENNSIVVNSNQINGHGKFGDAHGEFLLDLPYESDSRKSLFTLNLGLKNSDVLHHSSLTPNKVPKNVREWLDRSLQKGQVNQAGFIYRGGFSGDDNTRSYQLFINAEAVDLAFSDDWPALKNTTGTVLVDNEYIAVNTTKATIFGDAVDQLSVGWSGDGQRELSINANSRLSAATGLRLLTETGAKDQFTLDVTGWRVSGMIDTDIDVWLPLDDEGSKPARAGRQKIRVGFLGNKAEITSSLTTTINALTGDLFYSSDKGVSADTLSMEVLGGDLRVGIQAIMDPSLEAKQTVIEGQGSAAISDVALLLKRPELNLLNGQAPYQLRFTTPSTFAGNNEKNKGSHSAPPTLTITSDLRGVEIDLPEPFYKKKNDPQQLNVSSTFSTDLVEHEIVLERLATAELLVKETGISGFLSINKPFLAPVADDTFVVSGALDKVVVDEWLALKARYINEYGGAAMGEAAVNNSDYRLIYNMTIDQLVIKDTSFVDTILSGERLDKQWRTHISNSLVSGSVTVFDDEVTPINVVMDYITVPTPAVLKDDESSDSLAKNVKAENKTEKDFLKTADLSWLRPANVVIEQLNYHQSNLGRWQFTLAPTQRGIEVNDIQAAFSGMKLQGQTEQQGATLFWQTTNHLSAIDKEKLPIVEQKTTFVGRLKGGGVQALFENAELSPLLTSNQTFLEGDFSWQGSPAAFSINAMTGGLGVILNDGVFVQNTGAASSGILRLLGLLNFNTWARRLRLDFSDFYKKGVAYDEITTRFVFDKGWVYFQQPLQVKAPSSEFTMAGSIDYVNEKVDGILVTTLPVGGNLTFATALVAGLPTAVGVFIINKIFKSQVDKVSSLTYSVKGGWSEPELTFINIFDNKLSYGEAP